MINNILGRIKIHIHPDYKHLKHEFKRIVLKDYVPEHVFCNKRNVVEKINIMGKELVVKKYKRPTLANCFIYTFFRKTKARRAYENALRLLERGIKTPFPLAYIEIKKHGFFHTGYLITEYMPYQTLSELNIEEIDNEERKRLGNDLISFTISLQEKRVLPLDYNPGNIFYIRNNHTGHYDFALTDINRMRFGRLPWSKDAMRCFEQFGISTEHLYHFLLGYSIEKGVDIDLCMYQFLSYRLRKKISRFIKGKVKESINKHKNKS